MIEFLTAHGFDPGPAERPALAGAVTGAIAAVPSAALFIVAGSMRVLTRDILEVPIWIGVLIFAAAFIAAGAIYGMLFRRAANDRAGGWLFGLAFGFGAWMLAPIIILPLVGRPIIASGMAAEGFFGAFLLWGFLLGILFPHVHRPLRADLDGKSIRVLDQLGPSAATHHGRRMPGPPG